MFTVSIANEHKDKVIELFGAIKMPSILGNKFCIKADATMIKTLRLAKII